MHRRDFLWTGLSAAALAGTATRASPAAAPPHTANTPRFTPHRGQFSRHTGESLEAEFEFLAAHGFSAIEDRHLAKRPRAEQEKFGALAAAFGMQIGPFVAIEDYGRPTFASGRSSRRSSVLRDIDAAMEVASRTGAKSFLLVLGRRDPSQTLPAQLNHACALLRECLARTESSELTLLLEPASIPSARAPMLIETLHDAARLCRLVDHPRCQSVCDVYDWFATNDRNSLSDLTSFLQHHHEQVGHIALADFPGRKEPGTGTIDFSRLLESLKSTGYKHFLSMDHGASQPGVEGESQVLQTYTRRMA